MRLTWVPHSQLNMNVVKHRLQQILHGHNDQCPSLPFSLLFYIDLLKYEMQRYAGQRNMQMYISIYLFQIQNYSYLIQSQYLV